MHYQVIITPAEEGGFVAEVPALPGCFSQGETVEETLTNVREAIEGYLIVAGEPERDAPEAIVTSVSVPKPRLHHVAQAARAHC